MSKETTIVVELRVIDQLFRLSTTPTEQAGLESTVQTLNKRFQDARQLSPRAEHNRLVISVALSLMQEIITLKQSLQHYEQCHDLLHTMLQDIEQEKPTEQD